MPNNNSWSQLQICYLKKTNDRGKLVTYPKSVAWHIGGVGITFAEVSRIFLIIECFFFSIIWHHWFCVQIKSEWEEGTSSVMIQNRHLDHTPPEPIAISFILTEFHVLLLHVNKIVALSVLNKETVFSQSCDEVGVRLYSKFYFFYSSNEVIKNF